jgi:hypothetical protein
MDSNIHCIILSLVVILIVSVIMCDRYKKFKIRIGISKDGGQELKENFDVAMSDTSMFGDEANIINPTYLKERQDPVYTQEVIGRKDAEIMKLRNQVRKLAEVIDGGEEDENLMTKKFYRRKLNNANYGVAPFLSTLPDDYLNLYDDDFSNKTLSTVKFLSQTRQSKFYGKEVHYPTELCDNFCETEDKNAGLNEQVDLVRPVKETSYIPKVK